MANDVAAPSPSFPVWTPIWRAVDGPPAREDVHQLEIGERLDDGEEHDHHRHRHEQGPCHPPESLPGVGSVDGGRILDLGADGLEPREERDGEERHPPPDIDQDDRPHGSHRPAQPVHAHVDEAQAVEHPVHDAERGIEHPLPGQGGQDRGNDPGQEHGGPQEALESDQHVQHDRDGHAQRQLEHGRDGRVDERVLGRALEDRIVPQLDEIAEADEGPLAADQGVREAQPDAPPEGIGDEDGEHETGGREQGEREQPLTALARTGRPETAEPGADPPLLAREMFHRMGPRRTAPTPRARLMSFPPERR
jgi:hypothetical protein